jgi:hypothetical protein
LDNFRDERLTLELLEEIARATAGGQSTRSTEMETRQGWTREQVWRELELLWDEGLIRARSEKDLSDVGPDLLIQGLTGDGWARYAGLRRPVRFWFERNWKWVIGTVIAVAGIAATILVAP